MDVRIFSISFVFISLQFSVSLCGPRGCTADFTATFFGVIDWMVCLERLISDPEQTFFFKEDMGLRDGDVLEDAIKCFNDTYGLDFSNSSPNEQNEYFSGNA